MIKPYMIGIAGESGVGKSTIAEIVSLFLGINNTTIISTDDLHKWERTNPMWKEFTHLNPDANNLELGDLHLQDLSNRKPIYRSVYNHKTGYFDPPLKIIPNDNVIVEGLHSFYTKISKSLLDLKIFVDTDEDLRVHWKIIRDTEERGYTYNSALEAINKRRTDSVKVREQQIGIADVVIKLSPEKPIQHIGDRTEKINLVTTITFNKDVDKDLFEFIENYIHEFNKFVMASETLGQNLAMCQNGGGNVSVKISDKYMIIKASGFNMKDVYRLNGYSLLKYEDLKSDILDNEDFDFKLRESVVSLKYKRPSMETGFHTLLNKYVLHVHPIYLTTLLSLNDSKEIINKVFNTFTYEYIEYTNPGFSLYQKIKNTDLNKPLYFLENHGVIVSTDNMKDGVELILHVEKMAKDYINSIELVPEFDLSFATLVDDLHENYTFPDGVIFLHDKVKKEIIAAHNYINFIGQKLGKLRYLSSHDVFYLRNLESEKYRKTL